MRTIVCAALSLAAASCGVEGAGREDVEVRERALLSDNALNMNALNMNALNMNGLELSALSSITLSPDNLAAIRDPGTIGSIARQLVQYAVSCAFSPTQSFSFSWTDSRGVVHNEDYWGQLGLDTNWATKSLSNAGQKWVSACLAARVNWYGVPVTVSARGSTGGLNVTDAGELNTYIFEEGAFFGNIFGAIPVIYACNLPENDAHSRGQYRDCAAGHLMKNGSVQDCGIIQRVGSCSTQCAGLTNSGKYHPHCIDSADVTWSEVITVFLK
ncbi:hypothetical protein WMF31_39215 [Sorangium sp. So ce1036]|uniref:hypothetical protein n=1 Tax=Sorangium sp. So ce1036 TaxID=3133328 RepID=UPI003F0A5AE5